eukprot:gene15949-8239_t
MASHRRVCAPRAGAVPQGEWCKIHPHGWPWRPPDERVVPPGDCGDLVGATRLRAPSEEVQRALRDFKVGATWQLYGVADHDAERVRIHAVAFHLRTRRVYVDVQLSGGGYHMLDPWCVRPTSYLPHRTDMCALARCLSQGMEAMADVARDTLRIAQQHARGDPPRRRPPRPPPLDDPPPAPHRRRPPRPPARSPPPPPGQQRDARREGETSEEESRDGQLGSGGDESSGSGGSVSSGAYIEPPQRAHAHPPPRPPPPPPPPAPAAARRI